MLLGKTWKFWLLAISGFVLVSCCGLAGLAGLASNTTPTVVSTFQPTVAPPTALPTAKPEPTPEPTVDPLEECKPQVRGYLSNQLIVGRLLGEAMQMVSEGDLVGGYKQYDRARLAFGATTPPACDTDTQVLHNKMDLVIELLEASFVALSQGDFETGTTYIKETSPIINEMTQMVENIGRKYDF